MKIYRRDSKRNISPAMETSTSSVSKDVYSYSIKRHYPQRRSPKAVPKWRVSQMPTTTNMLKKSGECFHCKLLVIS